MSQELLNTTKSGVPRFLTTNLEVDSKETLSKAYALYLRDLRVKPKDALSMHISLKMLLPNLQRFD